MKSTAKTLALGAALLCLLAGGMALPALYEPLALMGRGGSCYSAGCAYIA